VVTNLKYVHPGKGKIRCPFLNNMRILCTTSFSEGVDLIELSQDRDQWLTVVKIVIKIKIPKKGRIFLEQLRYCQLLKKNRGVSCMIRTSYLALKYISFWSECIYCLRRLVKETYPAHLLTAEANELFVACQQ
jgi:hypothetical protein